MDIYDAIGIARDKSMLFVFWQSFSL